MKIECSKDVLYSAVRKAEKITGKNITLPVLNCLRMEVVKNNLNIKATNLELGIDITIPVKVEEAGMVAVPAGVVSNFISNLLDDKKISLKTNENTLEISTLKNSTKIKTYPIEDFPNLPIVSPEGSFSIQIKDLLKGLKSVYYSASVSSIKPELASVYIYNDDNNIIFVATDSFRLAEKKIKIKNPEKVGHILIPFKNVIEIIRVFDELVGEVEIHITKNQISFNYESIQLISRVIDGTFPDYKQIIPDEFKTEIVILKQDLLNTLKLANIFSNQFNQVNFDIDPNKKRGLISTKNNDVGENVSNLEAVLKGDALNINFNYKYIIDCFQSLDTDSVTLQFAGLSRPMVIKGVGDNSFMYLVMSMNR